MESFSHKGPVSADALAALAIVRALLKHMKASGTLIPKDIEKISADALAQIPPGNVDARNEARRLIEELKG